MVSIASRREHEPLTESERAVIEAAANSYHDALRHSREARAYLEERGIDRDVARRCRLGFGRPDLAEHLKRRRLSLAAAHRVGLLAGDFETMLDCIVVPDLRDGKADMAHRPLPTGAAALPESAPAQTVARPRRASRRRGRRHGRPLRTAEWPAQWGLPAVALLGTHVSQSAMKVLARFRRVYLALDSDEPENRHAAQQIAAALDGRGVIVELPPGVHDLNDLGRLRNGQKTFRRCLELSTISKERTWDTFDAASALRAA